MLRPKIETKFSELVEKWQTPGYTLEWGGEYEDSGRAQAALAGKLPLVGLLMLLVVVTLFNSIRLPLVIFLTSFRSCTAHSTGRSRDPGA